jgi:hypothetical protein
MVEENLVTKEELVMLFSNVKQLIEVNRMLLADIEKRVKDTNGNELGDSFLFLVRPHLCWKRRKKRSQITNATTTHNRVTG